MNDRSKQKRRIIFGIRMVMELGTVLFLSCYISYWKRVPELIQIEAGTTQHFSLHVPASGTLYQTEDQEGVAEVFLEQPITMTAGQTKKTYHLPLKLFGIFPFKQVGVEIVDGSRIYAVGDTYGFYLETEGVLVVGIGEFENEEGVMVSPAKNQLHIGDEIIAVNGRELSSKQELTDVVRESDGAEMLFRIKRDGKNQEVILSPVRSVDGNKKIGIWVRDNAQGVGTITYVDENGNFGALGHPIMDSDTEEILPMSSGRLYETEIIEIKQGNRNQIGEMTGLIDYSQKYICGELYQNNEKGIFGYSQKLAEQYGDEEAVNIAHKYEAHTGKATLCSTVSGEKRMYDVNILEVKQEDGGNRSITLQVTDDELIQLTGGIVQGMSGSPILQDGKLIGAVTHVFLSDPTKGYGVLIEDMMKNEWNVDNTIS